MTKADKNSLKLLEKITKMQGVYGMSLVSRILIPVAVLLIDVLLLFAAAEDDELYMILPFHIFFATIFIGTMSYIATSYIGDVQSLVSNNTAAMGIGGSIKGGDFLSTLPLHAKDVLFLRIKNFHIQLFTAIGTTIIVQILCLLAGNKGYTMHYGFGGATVIVLVIYELIMMATLYMKKPVPVMLTTAAAAVFPIVSVMGMASFADDHEKSAEFAGLVEFLEAFAKVPGMIFLAVCGAAIAFIAWKIADNKQNVSWNLR